MLCLALALCAAQDSLVFERIHIATPATLESDVVSVQGRRGDDRLFVVERRGVVWTLSGGELDRAPFLDLSSVVYNQGIEGGLRDIAFHPDHETNGLAYVWYQSTPGGGAVDPPLADMVVGRVSRDSSNPFLLDASTLVEILRIPMERFLHGGGSLAFGPEGRLWGAIGDGTDLGDPSCRAQDTITMQGTMFRIDVDAAFPYAIPADNPFVDDPGYAPEIVHYGLRHPWKWSFDRETGDVWIGDVGQYDFEEVDHVPAGTTGRNFGWPVMEGNSCFVFNSCPSTVAACNDPRYSPPVYDYPHGFGMCSIIGGYVYRGPALPELNGAYMWSDYCSNQIWTVRSAGASWEVALARATFLPEPAKNFSAFGETSEGEIVATTVDGEVYQLVRDCTAQTTCLGEPNQTGLRGVLSLTGSLSLAENQLMVRVSDLPAGTPALLLAGPGSSFAPLGSGYLCIGGSLARVDIGFASAEGRATWSLDLSAAPFTAGPAQVEDGATMGFQTWYRDATTSGQPTSNLTSAVSATFCP